ncbi:MAG: hypothetical protein V3S41_05120 [Spirochaetia bacterium]
MTTPGSCGQPRIVRRDGSMPAGVAVAPVVEGSRVLLVEVQALTVPAEGWNEPGVQRQARLTLGEPNGRGAGETPPETAVAGEISLAGEVRPVPQMARRARTGKEMGMSRCIGPAKTRDGETGAGGKWTGVSSIGDAVRVLFG